MRSRRLVVRVAWLAAAVVLALGAAGIVAASTTCRGGRAAARADLGRRHRRSRPGLDAATGRAAALADEVGRRWASGPHGAGRARRARRGGAADGDRRRDGPARRPSRPRRPRSATGCAGSPGAGEGMRPGSADHARALRRARRRAAVRGQRSPRTGTRLATGSVPAIELTTHLHEHDRIAGAAIRRRAAGRYAAAIDEARRCRGGARGRPRGPRRLAATVDVATLDQWIERNAAYDAAVAGPVERPASRTAA